MAYYTNSHTSIIEYTIEQSFSFEIGLRIDLNSARIEISKHHQQLQTTPTHSPKECLLLEYICADCKLI